MVISVDTETTGLEWHDTAFLATLACGDPPVGTYFNPAQYDLLREEMLAAEKWVFHNAKFDLQKLLLAGVILRDEITPDRFEDTEGLAHLLDEHRPKGLKSLARTVLGLETDEDETLKRVRKELKLKKADGYEVLPRDVLIPYAIKDAEFTLSLYLALYPQLLQYEDLCGLYAMEKEITLVLLDMESAGMALDLPYLEETAKAYAKDAVMTELDIRDMTGDEDFNPNSPKQVIEAFEKRGISLEKTDKDTLALVEDPLAERIVYLRGVRKIHGTYLSALLEEQRGGMVHPNFRQYRPITGRFSSGGQTE